MRRILVAIAITPRPPPETSHAWSQKAADATHTAPVHPVRFCIGRGSGDGYGTAFDNQVLYS